MKENRHFKRYFFPIKCSNGKSFKFEASHSITYLFKPYAKAPCFLKGFENRKSEHEELYKKINLINDNIELVLNKLG